MIGRALWSAISRTGDIYKIYGGSFRGDDHLCRVLEETRMIINNALARAPQRPEMSSKTDSGGRP